MELVILLIVVIPLALLIKVVSKRNEDPTELMRQSAQKEAWKKPTPEQMHKAQLEREEVDTARKKKVDDERESDRKEKVAADEKLAKLFATLKLNLPFYISDRMPSAELSDHDRKMWEDVTKLVQEQDSNQATLYFVKIRSLLDAGLFYTKSLLGNTGGTSNPNPAKSSLDKSTTCVCHQLYFRRNKRCVNLK